MQCLIRIFTVKTCWNLLASLIAISVVRCYMVILTTSLALKVMLLISQQDISHCMRFPTMWYVRQAKAQSSMRIRAVWSEPLLVAKILSDIKLLTDHHLKFLCLTGGCTCSSESTHVKMPHCGNLMSRLKFMFIGETGKGIRTDWLKKLFNPLCIDGFFLLVWYIKLRMVHWIYQGVTGYICPIKLYFSFFLSKANSVLCGISSGSSLFDKVLLNESLVYIWLTHISLASF